MNRLFAYFALAAALLIIACVDRAAAQSEESPGPTALLKDLDKTVAKNNGKSADPEPTPSPKPQRPMTWTGPYAGIYLGGNFANAVAHTSTEFTNHYFNMVNPPVVSDTGRRSISPSGVNIGGQIGYNYQLRPHVVIGAEADFGWMGGAKKSDDVTASYAFPPANSFAISQSVGTDWFLTGRGRAGYIWHGILIYGTGGVAMMNLNYEATFMDDFAAANESGSIKTTRLGWTGGIGGEYKLGPQFSIKLEGLYADLGRATTTSTNLTTSLGSTDPFTHSVYLKQKFVRFGINYHF